MIDSTFVESITSLVEGKVVDVADGQFSTKPIYAKPLPVEPRQDTLKVSTLTAVVDYVTAFLTPDQGNTLHVVSHREVHLIGPVFGVNRKRVGFLSSECSNREFVFNQFQDHPLFMVGLQSLFLDYGDRANVLKILGTIKEDAAKTSMDDGVTQRVTASTGVTLQQEVAIPNPVILKPYRTFLEIEQPPSAFVLRVQSRKDALPQVALFEGDGGRWKAEAIAGIRDYLAGKTTGITILA